MSTLDKLPSLHPERIAEAIAQLHRIDAAVFYGGESAPAIESALAALSIVQKAQSAFGLTSDVAHVGISLRELAGSIGKLMRRRK